MAASHSGCKIPPTIMAWLTSFPRQLLTSSACTCPPSGVAPGTSYSCKAAKTIQGREWWPEAHHSKKTSLHSAMLGFISVSSLCLGLGMSKHSSAAAPTDLVNSFFCCHPADYQEVMPKAAVPCLQNPGLCKWTVSLSLCQCWALRPGAYVVLVIEVSTAWPDSLLSVSVCRCPPPV